MLSDVGHVHPIINLCLTLVDSHKHSAQKERVTVTDRPVCETVMTLSMLCRFSTPYTISRYTCVLIDLLVGAKDRASIKFSCVVKWWWKNNHCGERTGDDILISRSQLIRILHLVFFFGLTSPSPFLWFFNSLCYSKMVFWYIENHMKSVLSFSVTVI